MPVIWNPRLKRTPIKRTGFGDKQRPKEQHEAKQALVLEGTNDRLGLFQLHHVDWMHLSAPRHDRGFLIGGYPDYFLLGDGWSAYLEIKHGKLAGVKGIGKLQTNQRDLHERLRKAGHTVEVAWLPEDLHRIQDWLEGHTGIHVDIDGLLR